ncbi:Protein FRA10AC1 [Eumeta japonica]|uniref:Protein FRA10AC1 n=1 Tax=Eumeta variegata TaxID=151549 RepID=A0A4C1ZE76_EUMVA|nr:Protein FRA10AC1 [Eumeta japonica]
MTLLNTCCHFRAVDSSAKSLEVALRWRVEREVVIGKGQFQCGDKRCNNDKDLKSWEVNFAYVEDNERKNALVKIRLCPDCSQKLNYKSKKREIKRLKKSQKKKKNKRCESDSETEVFEPRTPEPQNTPTTSAAMDSEKVDISDDSVLWKKGTLLTPRYRTSFHHEDGIFVGCRERLTLTLQSIIGSSAKSSRRPAVVAVAFFLIGRADSALLTPTQFLVAVNEALSAPRPIRAEVPKGSCLFPSLYATYTDDIPSPLGHFEDWEDDVMLALYANWQRLLRIVTTGRLSREEDLASL